MFALFQKHQSYLLLLTIVVFASFVLLMPLAITSTKTMQRRLKNRWVVLHKLIYIVPMLVILHFMWSLKADYSQPLFYTLIFLVLMLSRAWHDRKVAAIKKVS